MELSLVPVNYEEKSELGHVERITPKWRMVEIETTEDLKGDKQAVEEDAETEDLSEEAVIRCHARYERVERYKLLRAAIARLRAEGLLEATPGPEESPSMGVLQDTCVDDEEESRSVTPEAEVDPYEQRTFPLDDDELESILREWLDDVEEKNKKQVGDEPTELAFSAEAYNQPDWDRREANAANFSPRKTIRFVVMISIIIYYYILNKADIFKFITRLTESL